MAIRSMLRQSTILLILAAGLQGQTFAAAPQGQGRGEGGQERRENRPEHREVRPERREVKQERREDRREPREERQERQERRDPRAEPPRHVAPQPMPRPQPYAQPRGVPQNRPAPRLVPPSDPGSTGRFHEGHAYAPPPRSREQARSWESRHGWRSEGAWAAHSTWQEHRAHAWEREHRNWAARGGYGGYFIPEPQFRLHFGPDRWFRIRTRPMIHLGYPRFRYGNYWFLVVDPWPEFWSENWYATDDVYIDYNDGYYLYNRRHPGIAIAVSVSL